MKRTILRKGVGDIISIDYPSKDDFPLQDLENMLKALKDSEATHYNLHVNKNWYGDIYDIEIQGLFIQEETDAEYFARLEKEEECRKELERIAAKRLKERELELLRQLKEKYEKN